VTGSAFQAWKWQLIGMSYPSFLELRNCGGNPSEQLSQGCHPSALATKPLSHTVVSESKNSTSSSLLHIHAL